MALIIIDTDILIDIGRGDNTAIECLQRIEQQFQMCISAVTQMELIIGCRNKAELQNLEKFLQYCRLGGGTKPIPKPTDSSLYSI